MKLKYISLLIFSIFLLISCNKKQTVNKENVSSFLKNEEAQEKWKQNATANDVKVLKDLANTDQLVSTRKKVVMKENTQDSIPDPVMPEAMVAGVEMRFGRAVNSYKGTITINAISENKITGSLDKDNTAEIFYKLPGKKSLPQAKTNANYLLDYSEDVISGSLNKRILVYDTRSPFLLLLEEGSQQAYSKYFEEIDLSVKQSIGKEDDSCYLNIVFQNQSFNLALGERIIKKSLSGEVEFFLKACYFQKGGNLLTEGMPYFVKLYVYRVD